MSLALQAGVALVALLIASMGLGAGLITLTRRSVSLGLAPVVGLAATVWLACAGIFPGLPAWLVGLLIGIIALAGWAYAVQRGALHGVRLHAALTYIAAAGVAFAVTLTAPLVEGRVGIPGVALNNDLANHLKQVEYYIDPSSFPGTPIWEWYPTGGHAVAAVLAAPMGLDPVAAVNALMWATVITIACVGVAALRRLPTAFRVVGGALVGVPYLVAGYVGQGAFKEPLTAAFLAGAIVIIVQRPRGRGAFVAWPLVALVGVASVLVYSYVGAAWIAGTVIAVTVVSLGRSLLAGRWREIGNRLGSVVRTSGPSVLALVVATLALGLPFASNIRLTSRGTDAGVLGEAGNLVGPLSPLQWLGVWPSYDFRVGGFLVGSSDYVIAVVGLVLIGAVAGLIMRRAITYLAGLGVGVLLYAYLAHSSSWYFTAKGLVVLAPLVMIGVFLGLGTLFSSRLLPRLVRVAAIAFASAVGILGIVSSAIAFAGSPVGPMEHVDELRSLRSPLVGKSVLFMGDDDFAYWELAGAHVFPVLDGNATGLPPSEIWNTKRVPSPGAPVDLDYLKPSFISRFDAIVSPGGAALSAPPPGSTVLARTEHYVVWRPPPHAAARVATPDSGISPVGVVTCASGAPGGLQSIARRADAAFVVAPGELAPGASADVMIGLAPGEWDLAVQYYSPNPVTVEASGETFELPALLLRPTAFWPVGRIRVTGAAPTHVRFTVAAMRPFSSSKSPLTKKTRFGQMVAVRDRGVVRGERAGCGDSVDWIYATD